ncbi:hypothetical protein [Neobacillus sp. D3-1R]|uniref:hypothetical protein n=1 Tax=Neobacillus sp. D3-1R TaxID=3445778 RepID=UPI003FA14DE0
MFNKITKVLVITFIFLISIMTINPSNSFACSCAKPLGVKEEFERSKAVFYGKVMEIKDQKVNDGYIVKKVLFEVKTTWKGVSESQMIIVTGQGGGDCGVKFTQGEEYLIFANDSSIYGDTDYLSTGICDLTNEYHDANKDLLLLGEGMPPTQDVNLENEFNRSGISPYIWVLVGGIIGLVGTIIWFRKKNKRN